MNLLFLLPSIGYGLYLFLSSGSAVLLVLSALTFAIWSIVAGQRRFDTSEKVSIREGRIYLGDRRLNLFPWTWGTKVRDVVYPALFPEPRAKLELAELPQWAIGLTLDGHPLPSPITPLNPHAIIIGQTGSGKTELTKRLINAFQGDVIVIDFKGGFDYEFLDSPLTLVPGKSVERALELLQRRLSVPGNPTLVVVDELAEALREPKLAQQLELVTSKGRSLGVHFVGASQTMTSIPRTIWTNCHSRFALRADPIDRSQLGMPVKPLSLETHGYAELFSETLKGFFFPAAIATRRAETGNPLLVRATPRPSSAPSEEFAPFHQTPRDQL